MADKLTREEFDSLYDVGTIMCGDMIDAARTADLLNALGVGGTCHPAQRVTHKTTDAWVAIAGEYASALDALESNGAL